ncbi:hypothetical protein [Streptomyces sp. NRRL S-237]|nr:hypothetical protein [Streptomyces sp. NRRL S-237]
MTYPCCGRRARPICSRPDVHVSRTNHLQLYVCLESPEHPHTDLIQ